ncbi:Tungsten-containing formylmethanofuran dehydrogenase 2 subunit C [uncultured archaeon]|nr:Tungsten-containing formylmethanofuran dehydrogenase 2 subunit C [uncultured archaeon]
MNGGITADKTKAARVPIGDNNSIFTGKPSSLELLEKFVPQERIEKSRAITVKESASVAMLGKAFEKAMAPQKSCGSAADYMQACACVEGLEYAARDVLEFSIALGKYQTHPRFEECAGLFLSALINKSSEKNFTVITEHLENISELGYANTKDVIVRGNCGKGFASRMESGRAEVFGDAGESAGSGMKGGTVIIHGNTGDRPAADMHGGELFINGNAGYTAGEGMEGGKLEIFGNSDWMPGLDMRGGIVILHGNCPGNAGAFMKGGKMIIRGSPGGNPGGNGFAGRIFLEKKPASLEGAGTWVFQKAGMIYVPINVPEKYVITGWVFGSGLSDWILGKWSK